MGFKRNKAFACAIIAFVGLSGAQAQSVTTLRGNIEFLHSTHGNNFTGVSASYNKEFGKRWELGAGIEYSHTPTHDDNGWNLYHLHFVPVYLNEYYKLGTGHQWEPYIHLQQGVTFSSYYKELKDNPGLRYHVKEFGFYGAARAGANYYLSSRSGFFAEAGMKGFHLSFNNLDVNPHGITGKLGYVYRLKQ